MIDNDIRRNLGIRRNLFKTRRGKFKKDWICREKLSSLL